MSTPEDRDLRLRVRRLVVDADVLAQAGLGAAAFARTLQDALRRRAVGDTSAAGTATPAAARAIEQVADAVWSRLQASMHAASMPTGGHGDAQAHKLRHQVVHLSGPSAANDGRPVPAHEGGTE